MIAISLEHVGDLAAREEADAAVILPQRRVRQARRAAVRGERPPVSVSISVSVSVRISVRVSTVLVLELVLVLLVLVSDSSKRTPS